MAILRGTIALDGNGKVHNQVTTRLNTISTMPRAMLFTSLAGHGIDANSVVPCLILTNPATTRQSEGYGPEGSSAWWRACIRGGWAWQDEKGEGTPNGL